MRHYWYFSHNSKRPKSKYVVQTWLIGGLGMLVEVRTKVLTPQQIKTCDMAYIGCYNIHELIGGHLFRAVGINTDPGYQSK